MTREPPEMPAPGDDVRPLVAPPGNGNRAVWLFAIALALAAAALFYALEARRSALSSPAVTVPRDFGSETIAAPPELVLPQPDGPEPEYPLLLPRAAAESGGFFLPLDPAPAPPPALAPLRRYRTPVADEGVDEEYLEAPPRRVTPGRDGGFVPMAPAESEAQFGPSSGTERKTLSRFDNPSTTVPKGTIIHAVLESALDSTRAGGVRAIVSRNVASFDGSRVLIPRGSRLIGNYESDLARGQKRALILWTRLMLPSGAIMELDSPAADPLGRAGVGGKVNSHFLARFGGALLQSVLDIGVQAATRKVGGDTVVLNVPNPTQQAGTFGEDIQPTLTVKHGTSVAVFVAHDLDFGGRPD